jgi:hypothetical protein
MLDGDSPPISDKHIEKRPKRGRPRKEKPNQHQHQQLGQQQQLETVLSNTGRELNDQRADVVGGIDEEPSNLPDEENVDEDGTIGSGGWSENDMIPEDRREESSGTHNPHNSSGRTRRSRRQLYYCTFPGCSKGKVAI